MLRLGFLVVAALLIWFGLNAGSLLIEREPPAAADAIVVLAGNSPERLSHALRLREQGYSGLIIVSNERVHTHGVDTTWHDLYLAGLSASDLPPSSVLLIDPPPENTVHEAQRAAEILSSRGLTSALLVTDPFHSRRSALLFRPIFASHGLSVRSTPVQPDSLNLAQWWATPLAARRTAEEWTKLAAYLLQGAYW
jgi:uncharacterized SAM-binding protein YcdF (DUF218 family)